jgi:hypothetical protein
MEGAVFENGVKNIKIGDYVKAHWFKPDGSLSKNRRNFKVTKLKPLEGLEQWAGKGGKPRRSAKLSKFRIGPGSPFSIPGS